MVMYNKNLASDYLIRAGHRMVALEVLMNRKSYPDVVCKAQEVVELCLKALLRISGIEPPRSHDVGDILADSISKLPQTVRIHAAALSKISKKMRRDRELSFYGSEDLTPSDFYREEDAREAFEDARWVHATCKATAPQ